MTTEVKPLLLLSYDKPKVAMFDERWRMVVLEWKPEGSEAMSERERLQQEADDLEAKIKASCMDENGLRYAICILETQIGAVRHSTHGLVMEKRRVLKQIEELDSAPGAYP